MKKFGRLPKEQKTKCCWGCGKKYGKNPEWSNATWLASKFCSQDCCHGNPEYELPRGNRISEAQKGRPLTKEWRNALSKSLMGKAKSETHRKNMSLALKGKKPWNYGKDFGGHVNLDGRLVRGYKGKRLINARAVVETILGRSLKTTERVHHINGIKSDDRPENLYLFRNHSAHSRWHHFLRRHNLQGLLESNLIGQNI